LYALDRLVEDAGALDSLRLSMQSLVTSGVRCAKIKITSKCNLRCQMCHYWKTRTEEALDTAEWCRVLDELAGFGCLKVHFSGGEVFLRRDFLEIVEHACGRGMKVNLTTNGTLVDKIKVKRMVAARVRSVSLSLDGPSAEEHEAVRGVPGSFERTCETARMLRKYGDGRPSVRLNFVMMRQNYRAAARMVSLAAELGAVELHPMPVDEKGPRKNRLSRTQIARYNAEVAPLVLAAREAAGYSTAPHMIYPFGVSDEDVALSKKCMYARGFYDRKPCLAPWMHLFIGWDGACYLCCMTNRRMEALGNVRASSVQDVFNGDRFRTVRAEFLRGVMPPSCSRCDMFLSENARLHAVL
jgi:MoaA/NifB/PqqE/SkfB family radical SAM enzyme